MAKAYKKRTSRMGSEPGLYLLWRLELLRVHKFMENYSNAHYGLALVDGYREDHTCLQTAENEMVTQLHSKQEDQKGSYVRLLDRLLAEQQRALAERRGAA